MNLTIKTLDPAAMRKPFAGDWSWISPDELLVTVPDYGRQETSALILALREVVEAFLCRRDGVTTREGKEASKTYRQRQIATAIERELTIALSVKWEEHNKWVINIGRELERLDNHNELNKSALLRHGSRYWAELHLYALRVDSQVLPARDLRYWLDFWVAGIPFEGCPCEKHLKDYMEQTPPDFGNLFEWTVLLHNSVNQRIGKPTFATASAKLFWENKQF